MYSNDVFARFFIRYKSEVVTSKKFGPIILFETWCNDTRQKLVPIKVEAYSEPVQLDSSESNVPACFQYIVVRSF